MASSHSASRSGDGCCSTTATVPLVAAAHAARRARMRNDSAASSPVVGSSRKMMEGDAMSPQPIDRRRFSPPLSPRTRMPPGRAPPTWVYRAFQRPMMRRTSSMRALRSSASTA